MPTYLRALRSADFRLYFAGQVISLIGTWMQQAAMLWLAYRLSNSPAVLGAVGFASQIPILLFGMFGGVWIDRIERRKLLRVTQTLALLQSLLLAALTALDLVTPQILLLLAFLLGCMNAIDVPARQSIAMQLVDSPSDLQNAIALNSIFIQVGRFVGPALAGFAVAFGGEAMCFALNASSYIPLLIALAVIRAKSATGKPTPTFKALAQGLRYVRGDAHIRRSLLLVAAVSFFAMPCTVLLPQIAAEVFKGDVRDYGALASSVGVGSLLAALLLATLAGTEFLRRAVGIAAAVTGVSLLLLAQTASIKLAFVWLPVFGFATTLVFSGSNTLIQLRVLDEFRGRVMALFSMAFLGIAPLGNLAAGSITDLSTVRTTLLICGTSAVVAAVLYQLGVSRENGDGGI